MNEEKKFILKRIAGFILIFAGIAGLLFPIVPGWLLIFVGLELIGINLVFFDKIKEYAKEKIKKQKKKGNENDKSSN